MDIVYIVQRKPVEQPVLGKRQGESATRLPAKYRFVAVDTRTHEVMGVWDTEREALAYCNDQNSRLPKSR